MRFEHILQVNDLSRPELPTLTRNQLWQGLVLRARRPDKFLIGLDGYEILDQSSGYLKRCLELPGLTIRDEVRFTPESKVEYRILPTNSISGGSLTMSIEEPEPDSIFVRFTYCSLSIENEGDLLPYDQFVQQAYILTDIDTLIIIRDLAATGVF